MVSLKLLRRVFDKYIILVSLILGSHLIHTVKEYVQYWVLTQYLISEILFSCSILMRNTEYCVMVTGQMQ